MSGEAPSSPPQDARGVALRCDERSVYLKWHMLRRTPSDAGHWRANLETALARGARVEVDLRFSADGDGFCLHDATLDAETTGRGPVAAASSRALRALCQRGGDGSPLPAPPLELEEVVAAVRAAAPPRGAVQLDVKADARSVDASALERFGALLADSAAPFTVAGEEWPLVERLAAAAPGVRLGFEPLRLFEHDPPRRADGFRALAARMLAAAPRAEIVYLHTGLALAALAAGEDLVARLVDGGREVDCWTIDPHRTAVATTLRRLIDAGCGQVTTNGPEALEALWLSRP